MTGLVAECRKYWKFTEDQQHAHNYHDREDFITKVLMPVEDELSRRPHWLLHSLAKALTGPCEDGCRDRCLSVTESCARCQSRWWLEHHSQQPQQQQFSDCRRIPSPAQQRQLLADAFREQGVTVIGGPGPKLTPDMVRDLNALCVRLEREAERQEKIGAEVTAEQLRSDRYALSVLLGVAETLAAGETGS